jgi:hypothetical protein
MLVNSTTENDGNITEIESGCRDIEDCNDCLAGPETDKIETSAEAYDKPYCVNWCGGIIAYGAPYAMIR